MDPRVVVAEDPCVLLVPGRVARDLAELEPVSRERRLMKDDPVLGEQARFDALECLARTAVVDAGAAEDAPALALDEDLPLLIGVGADRAALGVP